MCGWWCARCPCASMFIFTEYNPHHKLRRLYYYTRISRKFARDSKKHHPPLTRDQQITITRNTHAPPHTLAHNIRYVHIYMCANTSDFSIRAATCGAQRRREDWISALQSQLDFARKKRCNIFITQSAPPCTPLGFHTGGWWWICGWIEVGKTRVSCVHRLCDQKRYYSTIW